MAVCSKLRWATAVTDAFRTRRPTLDRFFKLSAVVGKQSLTRALQYEILFELPFKGRVLDYGGGNRALYRRELRCEHYDSVNIDPKIDPTWVIAVDEPLPQDATGYDTALAINTLEHIFEAREVIEQLGRALKPGGQLLATTPFLYPIHAHPDDYFRPTPSWYRAALGKAGFTDVEVVPLAWGSATTALCSAGARGPFKTLRWKLALLSDLLAFVVRNKVRSGGSLEAYLERYATAFFVRATKST